eukprot:gb/GECH01012169.1/.p1 GENE.gb/GECH01012169.1/~~gb/GECH01012169.1/.p1  ORF type:complete len:354 (+),score=73.89 gb/GECH01012169.1/:1-1062(+)
MWFFSRNEEDQPEWKLKIRVVKGSNLLIGKTLVDPYVKIKLSESFPQQTQRVNKESNPEWNQTFQFTSHIYDPNRETVTITVKDHDRFTANDEVGQAQIPLFMLNLDREIWKRSWVPLGGNHRGEVLLEFFAENFDTSYPVINKMPENPMKRKDLEHVQWRIGDMLTFSGTNAFSEIIRYVTHAPITHCALVTGFDENSGEPLICEADGMEWQVRTVPLSKIFSSGPSTAVHLLRLAEKQREKFRKDKFLEWCQKKEGTPWDFWGTAGAAWQPFRGDEDLSSMFCSELIAGAYRAAGIIEHINASACTPIDCCRWNIWEPHYYQVKGEKDVHLPGYNTVDSEYFGMLQGMSDN